MQTKAGTPATATATRMPATAEKLYSNHNRDVSNCSDADASWGRQQRQGGQLKVRTGKPVVAGTNFLTRKNGAFIP
jgi:hypothetical protein